ALRSKIPAFVRKPMGAVASLLPIGFRGRTYAQSIALDTTAAVAQTGLYFDSESRSALSTVARDARDGLAADFLREKKAGSVRDLLQQLTRADFATYMCDDILVKVDRASMLASLEVRAPFLDQRIIEFAFGKVPRDLRTSLNERKILLKRLAKRLLPPTLDINRKRGFSIPLADWFRGDWGRYIESVLMDAPSALLNHKMVASLFAGQRKGLNNESRLFALVMLELWRREYNIELPPTTTRVNQ
ncbi:MAG: asparagine synthase-related protein, partial [Gemmatimonadaceae bacterium]